MSKSRDFKNIMEQVKKNYSDEELTEEAEEVEEVIEEAQEVEEEIEEERGEELAAPTYIRAHFTSTAKGDTKLISTYQAVSLLESDLIAAKEEINATLEKLESLTKKMMAKEGAIAANEKIAEEKEAKLRQNITDLKNAREELQKILA